MRIVLLGTLTAILTACSTTTNTVAPFTLKDGHVVLFNVGDCAKIGPKSKDFRRSDGTPVQVIFVDKKYTGYITYMDHPRLNKPSVLGSSIKKFDKNWIKIDCKK